jgi:Uma2 family endonuclease
MSASRTAEPLLTAEDLYALPDDDRRYELVEGRLLVSEPPGWSHGRMAVRIAVVLDTFVQARGLGEVAVESGHVLARRPDTVRGPDVSFLRTERLPPQDVAHRFHEGAPDLAVEILSPSDRAGEVARKVAGYLRAGTQAVWVVDPEDRTVVVHSPDGPARMHGPDATLDGGPVLPGFACVVSELFPPAA